MITGPDLAAAQQPIPASGAVLYELTENLNMRALAKGHRKASSELIGFALAGTPLCPRELVGAAEYCTINATGSDNISLLSGLGNFQGTLTVVVQGDNEVDGPELVVAKGRFSGKMDFSLPIVGLPGNPDVKVPIGFVTGTMALNGGKKRPFSGVFRLPFVPGPGFPAVYLLDDFQTIDVVAPEEHAIGYPTVRFEINF